jgi:hypothetical protein
MPFEFAVDKVTYEKDGTVLHGVVKAGAIDEPEVLVVLTQSGPFRGDMVSMEVYGSKMRPLGPDPELRIELVVAGHPPKHDIVVPCVAVTEDHPLAGRRAPLRPARGGGRRGASGSIGRTQETGGGIESERLRWS